MYQLFVWTALALLSGAAVVGGGAALTKAAAEIKKAWLAKRAAKGVK